MRIFDRPQQMVPRLCRITQTVVIVTVTLFPLHQAFCQSAFDSLRAGIAVSFQTGNDDLLQFWQPAPGPDVFIQTPFYLGAVRGGVETRRFRSFSPQRPDFIYFNYYLQWLLQYRTSRLSLSAGVLFGMSRWHFNRLKQDDLPVLLVEHELNAGGTLQVGYRPAGNWWLQIYGCRQTVFTQHKIQLITWGIAVVRSFRTPEWLVEVLQ